MPGVIGAGVGNVGLHQEHWHITFNLAAGITTADIGKAVALDTTAPETVKLAGDGDMIFGRLETVEDRLGEGILVGTISFAGILALPYVSGAAPAVGDLLIGGTVAGKVKTHTIAGGATGAKPMMYRVALRVDTTNLLVHALMR